MSDTLTGEPARLPPGPFALMGRLLRGPHDMAEGAVIIDGGKVVAIESPPANPRLLPRHRLSAAFVAPGFLDLQVNGGWGFEVGADPEALLELARRLPGSGVTSFLPTLISGTEDDYRAAFAAFDAALRQTSGNLHRASGGARLLGLHLEGPLLSAERAGAHQRAAIDGASAALVERLASQASSVRLVTLAPERAGALALIARLTSHGVAVALGHTDATFEAFTAGVDAGARLATHVFNAMSGFHHRRPGAIGAALTDDRVTALLIADGIHSHPAAFRLAALAKGPDRLGLISDAMAGAGLAPGPSRLGGRDVTVDQTSARLADGTLAGSILTLDRAIRNAVAFAGLTPAAAAHGATGVPGRALGPAGNGAGILAVGGEADVVLLDAEMNVQATFIGGALVHSGAADGEHARALPR